ncbi:MAG: BREX-1 system adenine-specific DNA-methyltransferase PglX [Bacteroidetes bacterium]|nr:BREX-1 system adenine-specific DNA-methyltransferase PglX [Bacteroidota bacterium]
MNTNKIKTFAKKARIILLKGVQQRIAYWGIDDKGNATEDVTPVEGGYMFRGEVFNDTTVPKKWESLKSALHRHTIDDIIEEAAYTWFNRLIALKILSKNGYIDPVYEYVSEELKDPVILQIARKGELGKLRDEEKKLLNQYLVESKDEEAFELLLTAYCRNQKLLNRIFGHLDDYTELLLPTNLLFGEGIIELINDNDAIEEEDYKEVELIGWLYQFYISDKKDEVFASFKKKKKARPEDIPAVTQIFTPKWIVKYMVENTVGRIWLDKHPESPLQEEMKYFVEPSDKENYKPEPIIENVTQLTLLDPACGSGHILVVGFDLMMQMYKEEGYSTRNAVESIIKNNLFGLDIDDRATQLANFAVLIKAASYYPEILKTDLMPNVYSFPEATTFTQGEIYKFLDEDAKQYADELEWALKELNQGKNIGSTLILNLQNDVTDVINKHYHILKNKAEKDDLDFEEQIIYNKIKPFIDIILILASKYHSVVTNPPYMGQRNMNEPLKEYVDSRYPVSKSDLFSVFMEILPNHTISQGYFALINLPSWLFLISFEEIRKIYLSQYSILSLIHMGRGIFGIDYGSVTFVIKKEFKLNHKGQYFRPHRRNFQHIYFKDIKKLFLYSKNKPSYKYNFDLYRDEKGVNEIPQDGTELGAKIFFSNVKQSDFSKIPGSPIVYWASKTIKEIFSRYKLIRDYYPPSAGLQTGDNKTYLRDWYEVSIKNIDLNGSKKRYSAYNKAGSFRKWYGNQYAVIFFRNNGEKLKSTKKAVFRNSKNYFNKSISWGLVSSGDFGVRFYPDGFIFDNGAPSIFPNEDDISYFLTFLNSKITSMLLKMLNPTLNYQVGNISSLPIIKSSNWEDSIDEFSKANINIAKTDWDSSETSWDFELNPLINNSNTTINNSLSEWNSQSSKDFFQLHQNEEELNKIFIDIYGLQGELTPEVPLKEITILQDELDFKKLEKAQKNVAKLREGGLEKFIKKDVVIRQLLSYAIGCFMGRYRLDKPGLHIAHPNPSDEEIKAYKILSPLHNGKKEVKFEIDEDGIIPMMGSEGRFSDDIVLRIKHFIEVVWGEETLTENINFIQQCLDQDLEEYLVDDFWYYHCKVYKKRPIYWLFSSDYGAFQVLVYMHRMNKFTIQKIRNNYLLKHLNYLRSEIAELEKRESSLSKTEAKKLDDLRSSEIECREYDKLMKDYADKQIEINLDDGVKVNYAKFEDIVTEI